MTIVTASIKRFGAAAIGVVLMAASMGAAIAEDQCPYRAPLLSLANTVLSERGGLSFFQARSYGSEAAFLKIRYGDMDDAATAAMLDQLVSARARFAPDLQLAWQIAHLGPDATAERWSQFAATAPATGVSAIRALILAGKGEDILDRFPDLDGSDQYDLIMSIVTAVIDQPDADKAAMADRAQARGLLGLAAALTATMRERGAWKRFARTVDDKVELDAWSRSFKWLPALVGNPVLPFVEEGLTDEERSNRTKLHDITIAAAMQPEGEFFTTVLNATGNIDAVLSVATHVRDEIETGGLSPRATLDLGWLFAYRGLGEALGTDEVRSILNTSSNPRRYGQPTIISIIDRITAIHALTPLVTGADDTPVAVPDDLPDEYRENWPHLVQLAAHVRANDSDPALLADTDDFLPIADLIYARGDMTALAKFVADAPPSMATVATAADFAKRLDRRCNAYLWHPGEAILLPAEPIFKFD